MNLKCLLYIIISIICFVALDSLRINEIFKKNKIVQARILYTMIAFALSYLVTNFLYDFFINSL